MFGSFKEAIENNVRPLLMGLMLGLVLIAIMEKRTEVRIVIAEERNINAKKLESYCYKNNLTDDECNTIKNYLDYNGTK